MIKKKEATLSHIDEYEKASMVDVNEKDITKRKAIASSKVFLNNTSYKLLKKNKYFVCRNCRINNVNVCFDDEMM